MKFCNKFHGLRVKVNTTMEYPLGTMALALLLIYLAPFVSLYLCYAAFLICVCRVIAYSPRIFMGDCALLLPLVQIFSTPDGMSLLVYLYLFAAVWYLLHGSVRANSTIVWFLLLMIYMIARMQLAIAPYLLSFGQVFLMYALLPQQDSDSAVCATKLFCIGLLVSSVYALLLRDSVQLVQIIGEESPAIWGLSIMRFRGLIRDPNYYMTMLIVALALIMKLRDSEHIGRILFAVYIVLFSIFGVLTYSKTFFISFILLIGFYILWQFASRKLIWGCVLTLLAVVGLTVLLLAESSPFAIVLSRLNTANNLNELTTGRTAAYADYLEIITDNPVNFLFGKGLAADGLVKDPHNIYIEIMYYVGVVGLILYSGFFVSLLLSMRTAVRKGWNMSIIGKYIVLIMVMLLFFTLHGIFQTIAAGDFMMAFLSTLIVKNPQVEKEKRLAYEQ